MVLTRSELEALYRGEKDPRVKERLLFILRVEGDGAIPSRVAERELHRSKPWASYWLDRYVIEGVEGLEDKPRSGRPLKIPTDIVVEIKRELAKSDNGWTTRQVAEMIAAKGGVEYHFTHIYRLLYKWGFKQKVPKKEHVNTASKEVKETFKKTPNTSWRTSLKGSP